MTVARASTSSDAGAGLVAAEFFAGMGLMRAALDRCGIETIFANDVDKTKALLYAENWAGGAFRLGDIGDIRGSELPRVDLATASFPCVDLSLAGHRAGLDGTRSGVVYEFCRILNEMAEPPAIVILENVPGFLTVNGGRDYRALVRQLERSGYRTTHICVDAAAFVPQSRLRVFLIGFRDFESVPMLPPPPSPRRDLRLADIVDEDLDWWEAPRRDAFLASLSDLQSARVDAFNAQSTISYRGAYRRTRRGRAVWEVRRDEIAGTLRTTQGGSGRQAMLRAGQGELAVRWMDVSEYAALQGAMDIKYASVSPRQAMYAFGDAVCVPAVEWLVNECVLPAATSGSDASPSWRRALAG